MLIAIHKSEFGFHPLWRQYCTQQSIPFKEVDCYDTNIVDDLKGCDALLWHHSQINPKDIVIAKQILFALEHTGLKVFPDFKTSWHFDDKLGQKYLFESINAPYVPSYAFFSKEKALDWVNSTSFPKVFKLRGGAGSSNVKLVNNKKEASKLIRQAFGKGFSNYDAFGSLKDRFRHWKEGRVSFWEVIKGIIRMFYKPNFAKTLGKEVGYVYFQEFIPNNDFDIRIIVIGKKAFGLKRFVRKNDFRASGSGRFTYAREEFDERCVQISFDVTDKLGLNVGVFDFVFDRTSTPLLVEVSYGYSIKAYNQCPGYWDDNLKWHEGSFNHEAWIIDELLKTLKNNSLNS